MTAGAVLASPSPRVTAAGNGAVEPTGVAAEPDPLGSPVGRGTDAVGDPVRIGNEFGAPSGRAPPWRNGGSASASSAVIPNRRSAALAKATLRARSLDATVPDVAITRVVAAR